MEIAISSSSSIFLDPSAESLNTKAETGVQLPQELLNLLQFDFIGTIPTLLPLNIIISKYTYLYSSPFFLVWLFPGT